MSNFLINPYWFVPVGLSDTDWSGAGSNTSVSDGTVTATTSDSNYRLGGTQITKNSFELKVVFAPNANSAKFGYGITYSAVPDDSDDLRWGLEWFAGAVSPDKLLRVKEGGVTKASWTWTTNDYFTIVVTAGEVVYTHYNSGDVEQNTYTSDSAFDSTSEDYYLSCMQGGYTESSNVYSQDNI